MSGGEFPNVNFGGSGLDPWSFGLFIYSLTRFRVLFLSKIFDILYSGNFVLMVAVIVWYRLCLCDHGTMIVRMTSSGFTPFYHINDPQIIDLWVDLTERLKLSRESRYLFLQSLRKNNPVTSFHM